MWIKCVVVNWILPSEIIDTTNNKPEFDWPIHRYSFSFLEIVEFFMLHMLGCK